MLYRAFLTAFTLIYCSILRADLLEKAENAFNEGDFVSAAELYQNALSDNPDNFRLLANLGFSYYRSGDAYQALAAYRTAFEYEPRDKTLQNNIKLLRQELEVKASEGEYFDTGLGLYPEELMWVASLMCFVFGLASGHFIFRKPKTLLGLLLSAPMFVGVGFYGFASYKNRLRTVHYSVVVPEQGVFGSPREEGATALFTITGGDIIQVTQHSEDWYKISLEDGRAGFVPERALQRF